MKRQLKYIELKSGFAGNGPAWIGFAEFSKSGRTVYFNGSALKSNGGSGIEGNHYDLETGDEYWVSGVKKDGKDRHWSGGGKIFIDRKAVDQYLEMVSANELDRRQFELVDIAPTDKQSFAEMENEKLEQKSLRNSIF